MTVAPLRLAISGHRQNLTGSQPTCCLASFWCVTGSRPASFFIMFHLRNSRAACLNRAPPCFPVPAVLPGRLPTGRIFCPPRDPHRKTESAMAPTFFWVALFLPGRLKRWRDNTAVEPSYTCYISIYQILTSFTLAWTFHFTYFTSLTFNSVGMSIAIPYQPTYNLSNGYHHLTFTDLLEPYQTSLD